MLLAGPPFNLSLERIGWLTPRRAQRLYLSHRDKDGILDLKALRQEERARDAKEQPPVDQWESYREVWRLQCVPEYLIEKHLKMMRAMQHGG